jgi:UTP--glucose-1-phosphate uridylyltransferase
MIYSTTQRIRKAVIPIAGLSTRLFPATRTVPKALLPILSRNQEATPLILILIEEAIQSGIERVGLVINPSQRPIIENFFHRDIPKATRLKTYSDPYMSAHRVRMQNLCGRVEMITQEEPNGFGDAVFQARSWVGGEPFLLMLGDHLYRSRSEEPCSRQLIQAYYQKKSDLVGLVRLPFEQARKRGTAALESMTDFPHRYRLLKIIEKPDLKTATHELLSPDDTIACFFGCYVFNPEIFEILAHYIESNLRYRGEFQLTEAMETLRAEKGLDGFEVNGDSLDIGNVSDYRTAFNFLVQSGDMTSCNA